MKSSISKNQKHFEKKCWWFCRLYGSVSMGRDKEFFVPVSLFPGTRAGPNCPGTNSSFLGRPGTKWIKNFQKNDQISSFWTSALSRFVPRPVPDFCCPVPSRPEFWLSRPIPSHPLTRFLACPVVPLSRDNERTSVPLSRKVALSRPVGNPSSDMISTHCETFKAADGGENMYVPPFSLR